MSTEMQRYQMFLEQQSKQVETVSHLIDRHGHANQRGLRCLQPLVNEVNRECFETGHDEDSILGAVGIPEHREDEERVVDDTWDDIVDECLPSPTDRPQTDDWGLRSKAGFIRRMNSEDLYKLGGRVIGRHDALVDRPWYLVTEYVAKRMGYKAPFTDEVLTQCKALVQAWMDLELNKESVLGSITEAKDMGLEAAVPFYQGLAGVVKDCDASPEDALEHINNDGFAHNRIDRATHDFTPELAVMLEEGVPSAAQIAHELHIHLKFAGAVRELLILQDFEGATQITQDATPDEEDDILDNHDGDRKDDDFGSFVSEGWHLVDDKDDPEEGVWPWLERQPAQVQVILHQTERAESLAEIKKMGEKVFQAYSEGWTQTQRAVFWMLWRMRKETLMSQLEQRVARVRKGTSKIRMADAKQLGLIGKKLFELQKSNPSFYTPDGWMVMWSAYKECKVRVSGKLAR